MTPVGILGGTFNPPHLGHLICASEAVDQLGLERVVLMPVAVPPHKALDDDPGGDARFELCRLAVARDDRFDVSRLELDRGGPSYTVDTLREIHASAPRPATTACPCRASSSTAAARPTRSIRCANCTSPTRRTT